MALGVTQAGFQHLALIEVERHACETIRANQTGGHSLAKAWPLHEVDVRDFDYGALRGEVDLLSAGVPCQPFSVAGKGRGHGDERDLFSEVARAARLLKPKAILIENVPGLLRPRFRPYFEYLRLALASPGFPRGKQESWRDHCECLRRHGQDKSTAPKYDVNFHMVNVADYGVPQWRERVIIVAFRSDLGVAWSLPAPTHSLDALLWAQYKTREYWRRHGLKRKKPGLMTKRCRSRLQRVREMETLKDKRLRWRTVRDAIADLPALRPGEESTDIDGHYLNPGARAYARHSGSLMDEPAKTLKAGSHGVPGGENTLALGSGKVRYFSVRECARFQTFPDDYVFTGPWSRAMRQVGNAVPVLLARRMAEAIRVCLVAAARQEQNVLRWTG